MILQENFPGCKVTFDAGQLQFTSAELKPQCRGSTEIGWMDGWMDRYSGHHILINPICVGFTHGTNRFHLGAGIRLNLGLGFSLTVCLG